MRHLLLFLCHFAILIPVATSNAQTFTVAQATTPWHHHWEESIGSGHAALTSRADWRAHLTRCATELGVKRTRFHGLLDDDFQISLQEGQPNYINLDSLIDFHLSIGMEPLFVVHAILARYQQDTNCHVLQRDNLSTCQHDKMGHCHLRYGATHSPQISQQHFYV